MSEPELGGNGCDVNVDEGANVEFEEGSDGSNDSGTLLLHAQSNCCTGDDFVAGPSRPKPKKRPAKKKFKGNVQAHGKNALDKTLADKAKQHREITPLSSKLKSLGKTKETNSWTVGVLRAKLAHLRDIEDNDEASFGEYVQEAIEDIAHDLNLAVRYAQKAALYLLEHLFADPEQHELLQSFITNGTKEDGGQVFWSGMLNLVYNGKSNSKSEAVIYLKGLPKFATFKIPKADKRIRGLFHV